MSRQSIREVERLLDLTEGITRAIDRLDSAGKSQLDSISREMRSLVARAEKVLDVNADYDNAMLLGAFAGGIAAYRKETWPMATPVDVGSYLRGK